MKKRIVGLLTGLFLSGFAWAHEPAALDSVGIERKGNQTFVLHDVAPKETLFGLSRRYGATVNDIIQQNDLKDGLKIGQRIRIPIVLAAELPSDARAHQVQPGETLFAISRRYEVAVDDLKRWNNLVGNDISVGQQLVVKGVAAAPATPAAPVAQAAATGAAAAERSRQTGAAASQNTEAAGREAVAPVRQVEETTAEVRSSTRSARRAEVQTPVVREESVAAAASATTPGGWRVHQVKQGETLFSIASRYDIKVDDLIRWNGLSSNNLASGQELRVGREAVPVERVPVIEAEVPIRANNRPTVASVEKVEDKSTGFKNLKQNGLAEVIDGTGNHKKYLVLHRDAPVGTIMSVRNAENDVTIFARVVGKLPDTGDNSKLLIKVSKAAYDQLRAVNARFPVEISY
ncbi:peptidoglycan-binding lysin domain-containing protein [Nitritalea halalkaliphila LW7]|uniref:Peptidoglycan-binding lysin domain-containing protein n=1 Tax=Nitritalea halalkaliphila LW7 TaxID=1189621 RepID=I5C9D4_9BACT|nr:LysM peptidoglycan-binding domain-containing protein [Nitritalea halalkaliphila]EIM78436.1 peptidoglycan-binding lysin domain-containing protein [Nitritalea halalkaliphila LW7]